jgi:hypothetical protein
MKRTVALGLGMVIVCSARVSFAGALGIPLDGFLTQFQTFVVGLGLIMGLVGLTVHFLIIRSVTFWRGVLDSSRKRAF